MRGFRLFRETLNAHIRTTLGKDPEKEVWEPIYEVIRNVYRAKEYRWKILLQIAEYFHFPKNQFGLSGSPRF